MTVIAPFMIEAWSARREDIKELGNTTKHQDYIKAKEAIKQTIESATKNTNKYQDYIKSQEAYLNTKEYQAYDKARNDTKKFRKAYMNTKEWQAKEQAYDDLRRGDWQKTKVWQDFIKIENKLHDIKEKACRDYSKTKEYQDYNKAGNKIKQITNSKEYKVWATKEYQDYKKSPKKLSGPSFYHTFSPSAIATTPSLFPKNPTKGAVNIGPDSPFFLAYKKAIDNYEKLGKAYKNTKEYKACQKAERHLFREANKAGQPFKKAYAEALQTWIPVQNTKEYQTYNKAVKAQGKTWKTIEASKEYQTYLEAEKTYKKFKSDLEIKILYSKTTEKTKKLENQKHVPSPIVQVNK